MRFHSHLCVEKSCQVYAKRLLNSVQVQTNNVVTICDALSSDMNRLKSLICSYKEDLRFAAIDFSATHSRFAHIIISLFVDNDQSHSDTKRVNDFKDSLQEILQSKEKLRMNNNNNNNNKNAIESIKNSEHLICLLKFLIQRLKEIDRLVSLETLTTERDCADIWASETSCDCEWNDSNTKGNRNAKRRSILSQKTIELVSNASDSQQNLSMDDTVDDFQSLPRSEDSNSDFDESDEFFTPPETPNTFYDTCDKPFNYNNYIYGLVILHPFTLMRNIYSHSRNNDFLLFILREEPTKTDNDVFNALHDTEIDKSAFPYVYNWYKALQSYTLEDRSW